MAGTTTSSRRTTLSGDALNDLLVQFNKLVDDVETLRAGLGTLGTNFNATLTKLDADAGVTDTNYNALQAVTTTTYDAAGDMTAAKIGNQAGTAITA